MKKPPGQNASDAPDPNADLAVNGAVEDVGHNKAYGRLLSKGLEHVPAHNVNRFKPLDASLGDSLLEGFE